MVDKKKEKENYKVPDKMWRQFQITLQVDGPLAASMPRTPEEIKAMLENRMPDVKPDNAVPISDLIEIIKHEVEDKSGSNESEEDDKDVPKPGWATFKSDENGLYYEGRCVRGHLKDCASQLNKFIGITAFKAKVANRVYIMTDKIPLDRIKPEGIEKRFIHVITPKGERSSFKFIDFVVSPVLVFELKLLNDGVITEEHLYKIFEYGSIHGMGQERSQGWGRYKLVSITEL